MARQQERARRTRAAIIKSAAVEFAKSGYAAASLNRILEGSRATKGAMYFHFDSKEDLARAVLESAVERYRSSLDRWLARDELDPLDALHGMLDEIALRLEHDIVVQAEFRLILEPDFYQEIPQSGGRIVARAIRCLAVRAVERGHLRPEANVDSFTETLTAALVGGRYLADRRTTEIRLRERFTEALEVVVQAMMAPSWAARFARQGWTTEAHLEEFGPTG